MYIHKEGFPTIAFTIILAMLVIYFSFSLAPWLFYSIAVFLIVFVFFIFSFFRNPKRSIPNPNTNSIYAPADGKVVVIEEVNEPEFLKTKVKQVSIFMSPLNVHVNRNPVSGTIEYEKYHKGKYLVAWHPKSSTENERHTTVYKTQHGRLLIRQIAGALARRIVNYTSTNESVIQGDDMGFIKFGSRVDLFLPLDAKINVTLNQVVKGNKDIVAFFN